jgi:hypothetical protein
MKALFPVNVSIAEKVFFSVLTLVGFFFAFFLIVMSTVGGSSPSSTFGGTEGIGGVSLGSRSPFGVEPRPEDFFFWALILKPRFVGSLLLHTTAFGRNSNITVPRSTLGCGKGKVNGIRKRR